VKPPGFGGAILTGPWVALRLALWNLCCLKQNLQGNPLVTSERNSILKREIVQDDEISTEEAEVQQLPDLPRFSLRRKIA